MLLFKYIRLFIFLIFFIFIYNNVNAQVSVIRYNKNTSGELKKNKVKEIRVFQGDSNKYLLHLYSVDAEGNIISHLNYDHHSKELGPMFEILLINKLSRTYLRGRKGSKEILYNKVVTYFSPSGKLLKSESEEHINNSDYTIEIFDTSNSGYINMTKWTMHDASGDTLRMIKHFKDRRIEENIVKEKDSTHWIEKERSLTLFDENGIYSEYSFYKNGQLHTHYTREQKEKENKFIREEENWNPLPVGDPRIDTIFTNTTTYTYPFPEISRGKYMAVIHYRSYNRDDPDHVDIYYRNGLLLKHIFVPRQESNERYEYTYR